MKILKDNAELQDNLMAHTTTHYQSPREIEITMKIIIQKQAPIRNTIIQCSQPRGRSHKKIFKEKAKKGTMFSPTRYPATCSTDYAT